MFHLYSFPWSTWQSVALLVLRLVVGVAFILHGLPKIKNPLHWMGDKVPSVFQLASAIAEFGGGIALILGFLTPFAAGLLVINMASALLLVHFPQHQPFVGGGPGGSFELPLVYLAVMLSLIATGPGLYSVDAQLWGSHNVAIERQGPLGSTLNR